MKITQLKNENIVTTKQIQPPLNKVLVGCPFCVDGTLKES